MALGKKTKEADDRSSISVFTGTGVGTEGMIFLVGAYPSYIEVYTNEKGLYQDMSAWMMGEHGGIMYKFAIDTQSGTAETIKVANGVVFSDNGESLTVHISKDVIQSGSEVYAVFHR